MTTFWESLGKLVYFLFYHLVTLIALQSTRNFSTYSRCPTKFSQQIATSLNEPLPVLGNQE